MENKLIDFFTNRYLKLILAFCAIMPVFVLIMDLFSITNDNGVTFSCSALGLKDAFKEHGAPSSMFVAVLFYPLYTGSFIVGILASIGAAAISFIHRKWANILCYVLLTTPTCAVLMCIGILSSFAEEDGVTYSPVLLVVLLWAGLVYTVTLTGFICSLISKRSYYFF